MDESIALLEVSKPSRSDRVETVAYAHIEVELRFLIRRIARKLEADLGRLRHDLDDIRGDDGGHLAYPALLGDAPRPRHTWHGDIVRRPPPKTYYERGAAFADWKPAAGPRLGRGAYGGANGGAPARRAYVSVGPEFNPTSPAHREWWGNITSADRPVVLNISTSDRPVY